jgi:hypothetical protein
MNVTQPVQSGVERRLERRITVKLPVSIRGVDPGGMRFEEATRTENVCRGGLAIMIRHTVAPGTILEISIPVPPRAGQPAGAFDTRGRVVHVKRAEEQKENVIGIELTGPRFNRVFILETT